MSMETQQQELATAANPTPTNSSSSVDNDYSHAIVKGKRTKRRRLRHYLPLPMPAAATPSTSSSAEASDGIDEEEEDMANCLILLAQGRFPEAAGPKPEALSQGEGVGGGWGDGGGGGRGERYTSRRLAEAATMSNGKASFYVYECKTCNKCFPSFQALGGHRSSHKKLKMATMAAAQEKKPREELSLQIGISTSYPNSNPLPNNNTTTTTTNPPAHHHHNSHNNNNNNNNASSNKPKVHECSFCGAEFSSGQALGGHMRRHRAEPAMPPGTEEAKQKSDVVLPLDLNLPAPADDDRGDLPGSPSFAFPRKRPVVFSPSALVGCHY